MSIYVIRVAPSSASENIMHTVIYVNDASECAGHKLCSYK